MLGKKKRDTDSLLCRPVGVIHTPFKELENMPIQPSGAAGVRGTVELFPEFADGLKDLDGFSHLILLYHFHESRGYKLIVTPFLDSEPRGVFATRAPKRPNPIGLSIVRLVQVRGYTLDIENVDILDGTPLLDIKPYVPEFDHQENCRIGWLEQVRGMAKAKKSDDRFRRDD
ncbi:MAG: tRNA (N6-threonylcarbamoyladenosine(37)-N6)-methyltransferase TrmO [Deltaproteobacteria bacterium]|nr:tRNA (N6-threonylcarbamoyladenosine(37)-N6)-methyltransferase TrmO [Deltaproteobacteria bacterium]NTV56774.1 tRNA (N6-threonylcarbamoyladenosine(37)-N6)-methyltransferase TrmO [Deltaproteobacteria bacterium]